jgi:hypothetical protein
LLSRTSKYCGIQDHRKSCLCDVRLTTVTTISADLTLGSVYADYVLRAFGTDMLDNQDGLLDFLEALAKANDAVKQVPDVNLVPTEMRDIVVDYLREPHSSILDVEIDLGFSVHDAVNALCNGRPSIIRTFDDMKWLQIEAILDSEPDIKQTAFGRLAGLTTESARSILRYYRG